MTQNERALEAKIEQRVKQRKDGTKLDKRMEKQHQLFVDNQLRRAKALEQMGKARDVWLMISGELRGKLTVEETERLSWLFQRVRHCEQIRAELADLKPYERVGKLGMLAGRDVSTIPALKRKLKNLGREINEFLKKNGLMPRAEVSYPLSAQTEFNHSKQTWEAIGAKYILDLAVSHYDKPPEILRFRNCALATCERLFYSAALHQRFCTNQCRQAFFDSSVNAKRKRKERDLLNRHIEKQKDEYLKKKKQDTVPIAIIRDLESQWKQYRTAELLQVKKSPNRSSAKKETIQ